MIVVEVDGKLFFGLLGNLFVCYVGFELFVYLIIKMYLYVKEFYVYRVDVIL